MNLKIRHLGGRDYQVTITVDGDTAEAIVDADSIFDIEQDVLQIAKEEGILEWMS